MKIGIKDIELYAGALPGKPPLNFEFAPGSITIFVGPNNSGKSVALKEIEQICSGESRANFVVKEINFNFPNTYEEVEALVKNFEIPAPDNNKTLAGHFWVGQHVFGEKDSHRHFQIQEQELRSTFRDKNLERLKQLAFRFYVLRLDGRSRFSLIDSRASGNLQEYPRNHLTALFVDDAKREKVRALTEKAFNLHFIIDPTDLGKFHIRMSQRKPMDAREERGLDTNSCTFHKEATLLSELGDGVKTFVGLTSAIMSLQHEIILIDEPEAFLHPPLARRLGNDLAKTVEERKAILVTSTHSSSFLMGCIESTAPVNIVRLTYEQGTATARLVDSAVIKQIFKSALLRSTGIMQAPFHRAVVVTEADTDRAFYDEINRRLVIENEGIQDAIFLNAQGLTSISQILKPLRMLGISTAAIVDLDIIKNEGVFINLLNACNVPNVEHKDLEELRKYLLGAFEKISVIADQKPAIKRGGITKLPEPDQTKLKDFIERIATYGLFLVPLGEVESWLHNSESPIKSHGPKWLIKIFNLIGDSDGDKNYLKPQNDDVWFFIREIAKWINNPNRKGIL